MVFDSMKSKNKQGNQYLASKTIIGLKRAVVKDLKDKDKLNRVTLNFIDDNLEVKNVPVVTNFAGKDYGIVCIPSVGDEVLVGFLGGEISKPIILGSLYNSTCKPPVAINDKNEIIMAAFPAGLKVEFNNKKDKQKVMITTKKGHKINVDDDKEAVSIENKDGKTSFKIDFKKGNIEIKASKKISFSAGQDTMSLEDGKGLTVKSNGGGFTADVNKAQIKAKSNAEITANSQVNIKGNAGANVESTGQTVVKGAMVKIN